MRRAADTIHRQWEMLRSLPRFPNRISTPQLKAKLRELGHDVNIRTIQRDLDGLSALFPLNSDREGQTNYWFWSEAGSALEIPAMNVPTALTLFLAKDYLRPLLPGVVLRPLGGYFKRAEEILSATRFADWRQKVRLIDRGPSLMPADIASDVREIVYEALLENRQFECDYQAKGADSPKHFVVHPLGLVIRQGVFYLVCTLWQYDDLRHLALHRMSNPILLDKTVNKPIDFDLTEYIQDESSFAYPYSPELLSIKVLFDSHAADHLYETPLAVNQILRIMEDGRIELSASVPDTSELRWWLLAFGAQVEIEEPFSLREEFQETARRMAASYCTKDGPVKNASV